MAVLDLSLFRAQIPTMTEALYSDGTVTVFWDIATDYIDNTHDNPCMMLNGKRLAYALNLMTAHLLAINKSMLDSDDANSEQGGFITSASIGDVSVTKAEIPSTDVWSWWLGQTPFGQQLMALLSIAAVGGTSVGGLDERSGFRKAGGVFL